jgi:twinkle protein
MEINGFEIEVFNQYKLPDNVKTFTCPLCSNSRKKKTQKCLTVYWESGMAKCSHCGEVVQLHTYKSKKEKTSYIIPTWSNDTDLNDKVVKYFENRGISQFTLRLMKISEGIEPMPCKDGWDKKNTIQFPYFRNGNIIDIKYRSADKNFKLFKGAERMAYNIDNVIGQEVIYAVEGEIDVLSVMEVGIHNVISPPNGFTKDGNINLDWLNNDVEHFISAKKIVLAFDNDVPGENGKKEFIRRFGAHKCYTVDLRDCKDSNDYLLKYGKEALKSAMGAHIEIPLEGVSTYLSHKDRVRDFFINGMPKGIITGNMRALDEVFSTNLAQILLVTGRPGSGKSEVVDQMCMGYAINSGYKTAFASVENKPNELHMQKLIRKVHGSSPKSRSDFNKAFEACEQFIDESFCFIDFEKNYELEGVLKKAEELVYRKGIRILVLDPFNKIKYKGKVDSITGNRTNDYTNVYLEKLDEFARKFQVLIILVAHPVKLSKMDNGKRSIPDFYDVKGGGEFYDMCHHGLVVDRDYDLGYTLVRTMKVKFAHLGESNKDAWYKYNVNSGRLNDIDGSIEEPMNISIPWDNQNWITKNMGNEEQKEISIDSGLEINTSFFDNEEAPF